MLIRRIAGAKVSRFTMREYSQVNFWNTESSQDGAHVFRPLA